MNYIDLAFALFALLAVTAGVKNGFLASLIRMLRFVIIIPVSYFLSSYLFTLRADDMQAQSLPHDLQKIILFAECFAVIYILSGILIFILKKLQNKKHMPFRYTNALLGALFALARVLIVICVISFIFVRIADYLPDDNAFYLCVKASRIITALNNCDIYQNTLYIPAFTAYQI